jgi:hypothetical protein
MNCKKLVLPFLAISVLSASALQVSETKDKIKVGSSLAAGLAAGAAVGKYMPGPLPAKIVAGAATTALVTPWLVFQSLRNLPLYEIDGTWKEEAKKASEAGIMLGIITAPILGTTLGLCVGPKIGAGITVAGIIPSIAYAFNKLMGAAVQVSK